MIEDPELATLFRDEADEHLRALEAGLLRLEATPGESATLEEILREAHSLKGAARMLGLSDIELLAHAMEDRLRSATRGVAPLADEDAEQLLHGVDALRALCREALEDTPSGVSVTAVLDALRPGGQTPSEAVAPPVPEPEPEPEPEPQARTEAPALVAPEPIVEHRIETIRVAPQKLDSLMNQSGELTVARTRAARRLVEAAELHRDWETLFETQRFDRHVVTSRLSGVDPTVARQLADAWEEQEGNLRHIGAGLRGLLDRLADDVARLDSVGEKLDDRIREVRMLPLSTVFDQFQRMVRDISRSLGKEVVLIEEGGETLADKRIIEEMKDPLMHIIRNSIHHGIEEPAQRVAVGKEPIGTIRISGSLDGSTVRIAVTDDGRGLDLDRIRSAALRRGLVPEAELLAMEDCDVEQLLFMSGLSTSEIVTDISGRGVGMDVVRTNVESLKGRIEVESHPGVGCMFTCLLPQALSTSRVLLTRVSGYAYGIPLDAIRVVLHARRGDVYRVDGRDCLTVEGKPVSIVHATQLLELSVPSRGNANAPLRCVVLGEGSERLALIVDEIVEEQEIVVKPIGAPMTRVRNVTGAGILGTGEVCIVLNPGDIFRTVRGRPRPTRPDLPVTPSARSLVVLVVEDSVTTRVQEKRILEEAGYEVHLAVDGEDAWRQLADIAVDAVVTDVTMPNLDGIGLTKRIRASEKLADLPVVLLTSLASDEDRRRGLVAGANAYLTKAGFDQSVLLETLHRLIGRTTDVRA